MTALYRYERDGDAVGGSVARLIVRPGRALGGGRAALADPFAELGVEGLGFGARAGGAIALAGEVKEEGDGEGDQAEEAEVAGEDQGDVRRPVQQQVDGDRDPGQGEETRQVEDPGEAGVEPLADQVERENAEMPRRTRIT